MRIESEKLSSKTRRKTHHTAPGPRPRPGPPPPPPAEPPRVRPGSLTEDNPWPHVCFPTWESPDPIEKHPWVTPTTYTPRVGRLLTTRSARPEPLASTVQRRIKSPTGFQAPPP